MKDRAYSTRLSRARKTTSFFCMDILTLCTARPEYINKNTSVMMSSAVMACHLGNWSLLLARSSYLLCLYGVCTKLLH